MGETGWSFRQVGECTLDQLLAVLKGIRKKSGMIWGKAEGGEGDRTANTRKFEARVKAAKRATGRETVGLNEVI